MRNLILGYAVGLAQEEIDRFCLSAMMSAKTNTDIVLFGTDIHPTDSMSSLVRIFVVPTTNIWQGVTKDPWRLRWACTYFTSTIAARLTNLAAFFFHILFHSQVNTGEISISFLHPALARYRLYQKYLEANSTTYTSVLISDVRDVYFQDDIFAKMTFEFSTFVEIESSRCSQRTNRRWIKSVYGERIARSMDEQRVICSGISVGRTSNMKHYLSCMVEEIGSGGRIPYADQGIHNVLIRLCNFPATIIENKEGIVLTAAGEDSLHDFVIREDFIVNGDGNPFAIVHQFDRHAKLRDAITRQHCARKRRFAHF